HAERVPGLIGDEAGGVEAVLPHKLFDLVDGRQQIGRVADLDDPRRSAHPQPSRAAIDLQQDVDHLLAVYNDRAWSTPRGTEARTRRRRAWRRTSRATSPWRSATAWSRPWRLMPRRSRRSSTRRSGP